jgi:hypothetical protein
MQSKQIETKKRIYTYPEISCVKLDSEISLALESNPPFGPSEDLVQAADSNQISVYKENIV